MSTLICPECQREYPAGTIMCMHDGYEFEDEDDDSPDEPIPVMVQVDSTPDDLHVPAPRNGHLIQLPDAPVGPLVHIDVLHVDGVDFEPGTYTQSFPLSALGKGEIRVGRRTKGGLPPYTPEIDFYELLKTSGQESPWPISRLQATMLLVNGEPALRHKPENTTTWVRTTRTTKHRPVRTNAVVMLNQRDVITFGKPGRRYVRFRITWDH